MVFGLNSGHDTAEDLDAFMNAFQMTFPILLDAGGAYQQYRQSGATSPYPLDYIIDQEGRVAYFSTEYDPEAMIEVIDGLLDSPTAVSEIPLAQRLHLEAAPNPFNPQTQLLFTLDRNQAVSLRIMDQRGHLVRRLLTSESFPAGQNQVTWNGKDDQGRSLPSGLYMAQIQTVEGSAVTKLMMVQ